MANVNSFIIYGPWESAGGADYRVETIVAIDTDNTDMYTCKGYVRVGYRTRNLDTGSSFGTGTLKNSAGKTLSVPIEKHDNGYYYSSLDVQFEQSYNTALNVSCSIGHTGGSGTKYESKLSKSITLYPPCPRTFAELGLKVNGTSVTKNLQVIKVNSIDDELMITFNAYKPFGNASQAARLYSIGYASQGGTSNVSETVPAVAYSGGQPEKTTVTISTTVKDLMETYYPQQQTMGALYRYESRAQDLIASYPDGQFFLNPYGPYPQAELSKQFIAGNVMGCGCICLTLNLLSSWGSGSDLVYWSMCAADEFNSQGPSFVLFVGPFVKYKDSSGVVHDAKLSRGTLLVDDSVKVVSMYKGQYKDQDGAVHNIV